MAKENYKVTVELLPGSPHQKHVVGLIEEYLTGKVDDPQKVALTVWRITRIEVRPVRPPPQDPL